MNEFAESGSVTELRMRTVIYVQVVAAVLGVVVGHSEINVWLFWAGSLLPLAYVAIAIAFVSPILVACDAIRIVTSGAAMMATILLPISVALSTLVFWGLQPLVQ